VPDDGISLLDALRDRSRIRSVKDGCSPQGQCGCCTVWVDGSPRVACVTPVRRVQGREITTLEGLPDATRKCWADALLTTGGSQCGFCTPGIVMRLAALVGPDTSGSSGPSVDQVDRALLAHLCRCTGWQTIEEAADLVAGSVAGSVAGAPSNPAPRDLQRASQRATLEGHVPQQVGAPVVLGRAGFAEDTCPADALVAVPDGVGNYVLEETLAAARARAGKVQGRRTSLSLGHPIAIPDGAWDLTLQTTWVEPAYVEPDASWCEPGGEPASPVANGGSFGGKLHSPVAADARRLADEHGRPVRVVWSREDVVRFGPKRPPVAGGINRDESGVLRVGISADPAQARAEELASIETAVSAVAPGLVLELVPVHGPKSSFDLRAAVWAEAAVLAACARVRGAGGAGGAGGATDARQSIVDVPVEIVTPEGGRALVRCLPDGTIDVEVDAGEVLDETVLRSYCIGATHQALGWVGAEGIAVDDDGIVHDLTVRSFGVLPARDMPRVTVTTRTAERAPVNGSDAVFAAVAASRWLADGLPPTWPTGAGNRKGGM
jgi:xanthine dehydrogenase small subunit